MDGMASAAPAPVARHLFTVDEYHRMGEAGIFGEDDRVELIEGEIIEMSPIGSPHAARVKRLTQLLVRRLGTRAIVQVQDPVVLSQLSEPQPDLAVVKARADFYAAGHPQPTDILLVVEVADTSRVFDRNVKAPLYAPCGGCRALGRGCNRRGH
jgi:Uma2 family endonuclease